MAADMGSLRGKRGLFGFALLLLAIGIGTILLHFHGASDPASLAPLARHLRLEDEQGRPFTETDIRARPTALFLGYASCPDVCPTTLSRMNRWARQMTPGEARRLTFAFLTIDPERDTMAVRRTYVRAFGSNIRGLSGAPDEIRRVSELIEAPYRVELDDRGGYAFAHSGDVIIVGVDGRVIERIAPERSDDEVVRMLRKLLQNIVRKSGN